MADAQQETEKQMLRIVQLEQQVVQLEGLRQHLADAKVSGRSKRRVHCILITNGIWRAYFLVYFLVLQIL